MGTDDAVDKAQVHADLLSHLARNVANLDETVRRDAQDAVPAQDEEFGVDDTAQQAEAGYMAEAFSEVEATQRARLETAQALDLSPTDVIGPGAVISLSGQHYVIGVACDAFTSGGVRYTGVGVDAPLYPELEGRRAGDTVSLRGRERTIESVR